jgi:polar amino acid transport system substrate-binding protein
MHIWFSTEARTRRSSSVTIAGLRHVLLGAFWLAGVFAPISGHAAPAGCAALQAKYPDLKGKQLVNAINPHTPGYEAIDPKDPNKYVGFDIDLGEQIGECLGFTLTYKAVTFAALLTTLSSGQADIVISDIYATEERAKAADFITYSKVFDGVLVAKGNPKKITGINLSMCGAAAAENTGFVEVPLVQALIPECKAAGKPEPTLQLYDNNANCSTSLTNSGSSAEVGLIRRLAVEDGLTMIISTHQIRFADEVADRVVFLSGGSIIEEGPAHDVLTNPQHPVTVRFLRVMEAGKSPERTA